MVPQKNRTMTALPSQAQLNERFEYRNGHLFWKENIGRRIKVGDRAGGALAYSNGVLVRVAGPKIDGKTTAIARVIWIMHRGDIPGGMLTHHINGDVTDNRIENLLLLTRSELTHLLAMRQLDIGELAFTPRRGKLMVTLGQVGLPRDYLGLFATHEKAAAAYRAASWGLYPRLYTLGLL
jgi:hypothetical protein